jgi:hypothetical protein
MWLASGFAGLLTGQLQVFVVATGPFGIVCGYLFGVSLIRRNGHDANGNGAG